MNSAESQSAQRSWRQTLQSIGRKRGMLELWTGVIGARAMEHHAEMSRRNQEAENRCVRQQLWGNDGGAGEDDDMGNTILGDVTNPTPIVVNGQQSNNLLPTVLAVVAGALIPGAGVAGYLLNAALVKPDIALPAQQFTDSSVSLGLGKIEDYLRADEKQIKK
ncbi:MAG: hypothetical protein ABGZ53_33150 [Fuerstiella sp.]